MTPAGEVTPDATSGASSCVGALNPSASELRKPPGLAQAPSAFIAGRV